MKFNFLKVVVTDKESLNELINDGVCTSIEDYPFDYNQEYDYAQMALVDTDKNNIIYWNDNIHDNPQRFISAFITGLKYCNVDYEIKEVVMMDSELNKYSGEKY